MELNEMKLKICHRTMNLSNADAQEYHCIGDRCMACKKTDDIFGYECYDLRSRF